MPLNDPQEYFSRPNTIPPVSWQMIPKEKLAVNRGNVEKTCRRIADSLVSVYGEDVVSYSIDSSHVTTPFNCAPQSITFSELGIQPSGKAGTYVVARLSAGATLNVREATPVRLWVNGKERNRLENRHIKPVWIVLYFTPIPERINFEVENGSLTTLPFSENSEDVFLLVLGPTPCKGIPGFEKVLNDIHDVNEPCIFTRGWMGYRSKPVGFYTERPGVILGLVPRSQTYGLKKQKHHAWKTYGAWLYPTGVALTGLQRCAEVFGESKYSSFVRKHFNFVSRYFNHARWEFSLSREHDLLFQLVRLSSLDDCGAIGSSMAEAYLRQPEKEWLPILERVAFYILNRLGRAPDGTFCRRKGSRGGRGNREIRIWADDVYHSSAFLVKMGIITGNNTYFNESARQMLLFANKLFDKDIKLFVHCYYETEGIRSPAHWGRADGWAFVAETELLEYLPIDHPARDTILDQYRNHVEGRLATQDSSGFWRQLLDRPDSYLETSSTAMAVYCLARGVRRKWFLGNTAEIARCAALKGWNAITRRHIHSNGIIEGTCKGTDIRLNLDYYYRRPVVTNDLHGVGPILMAGAEIAHCISEKE